MVSYGMVLLLKSASYTVYSYSFSIARPRDMLEDRSSRTNWDMYIFGESIVGLLQVARFLMKTVSQLGSGKRPIGTIAYMARAEDLLQCRCRVQKGTHFYHFSLWNLQLHAVIVPFEVIVYGKCSGLCTCV